MIIETGFTGLLNTPLGIIHKVISGCLGMDYKGMRTMFKVQCSMIMLRPLPDGLFVGQVKINSEINTCDMDQSISDSSIICR